mmetsp:Transcript_2426/g.3347  ORF Transcript_2426/g.3347 Transcript_2426/m.3347 type:complete len:100 (+) Transcript_2426:102-401(+)
MEIVTASHLEDEELLKLVELYTKIDGLNARNKRTTLRRFFKKLKIGSSSSLGRILRRCFRKHTSRERLQERMANFIACVSYTLKDASRNRGCTHSRINF